MKRLAALVPLLAGITFVSFAVIRLAPGDTVDVASGMQAKMTAQAREKLREVYGLDRPLWVQYADWAGRAARLDLGRSFVDGEPVTTKIARALPVTLGINLLSLCLMLGAGIPLGVWSAARRGRASDRATGAVSVAAYSMPTFWLALVLMSVLGVQWRLVPVVGLVSVFHEELPPLLRVLDVAHHLVLPVCVGAVTGLAGVSRYVRSGVIEALDRPFVRALRAKGLSEQAVLYRHALKHALLPVITILGLSVPGLLGGSVIFESIFSIPGMGRLFYQSVFTRDYPVIMGMLLLGAVMTLAGNTAADLCYRAADPRARGSSR